MSRRSIAILLCLLLPLAGRPARGQTTVTPHSEARHEVVVEKDVKVAAREGKCWEPAEKEVKLPKYEKWPGYENNLQFVIRRYCGLWGRGT